MEETHKKFFSKNKFKYDIKVLHLGGGFKDTEGGFMLPDNWLSLHIFQNKRVSILAS